MAMLRMSFPQQIYLSRCGAFCAFTLCYKHAVMRAQGDGSIYHRAHS